jgi:hypothetical protein
MTSPREFPKLSKSYHERDNNVMGISIAVVGVKDGLGRSKMTYGYFLPPFEKTLETSGMLVRHYSYREFILYGQHHDAAILLYGEDQARKTLHVWNIIEEASRAATSRKIFLVHAPSIGRIIADKTLTNETLTEGGVEVPKRVSAAVAPFKVFSNKNMGTHAPTYMVEARLPLDRSRYNTEWIDTRHEHNGRSYYVVLRAMAVGSRCVSIFLRARPADQGDASVHNTDTPIDAELWNALYRRIVIPQTQAIESLCEQIANVLGIGFFSHDVLPESSSGRLLVCETGFKFDDRLFRSHLMPLSGQLVADDFLSDRFPIRSAEFFASELSRAICPTREPPSERPWRSRPAGEA